MQRHHPYGGYDNGPPPGAGRGGYNNAGRGGFVGRGRGGGGAAGGGGPGPMRHNQQKAPQLQGSPPAPAGRGGPPVQHQYQHLHQQSPPPYQSTQYTQPAPQQQRHYPAAPPVPPQQQQQQQQPPQEGYNSGYAASPGPSGYGNDGQGYGYPPPPPMSSTSSTDMRDGFADPDQRRKDYDAEGHKIEARIKKERPCRVLFVRNVKYNSDTGLLKEKFSALGEMKAFFDLVSTRGLIFVTYYDLRTAIAAREQMQGFEIAGRPIDVHYSLPRDEETPNRRCDRDRNQGTIRIVLNDSRTHIQEFELDRMFRGFGAIKGIYHSGGDPSRERLLEYFDSRAMSDAFDRMQGVAYPQAAGGGRLEVHLDWDIKDIPLSKPPPATARAPGVGPDGRGGPKMVPQNSGDRQPLAPGIAQYPPQPQQQAQQRATLPYNGHPPPGTPQSFGGLVQPQHSPAPSTASSYGALASSYPPQFRQPQLQTQHQQQAPPQYGQQQQQRQPQPQQQQQQQPPRPPIPPPSHYPQPTPLHQSYPPPQQHRQPAHQQHQQPQPQDYPPAPAPAQPQYAQQPHQQQYSGPPPQAPLPRQQPTPVQNYTADSFPPPPQGQAYGAPPPRQQHQPYGQQPPSTPVPPAPSYPPPSVQRQQQQHTQPQGSQPPDLNNLLASLGHLSPGNSKALQATPSYDRRPSVPLPASLSQQRQVGRSDSPYQPQGQVHPQSGQQNGFSPPAPSNYEPVPPNFSPSAPVPSSAPYALPRHSHSRSSDFSASLPPTSSLSNGVPSSISASSSLPSGDLLALLRDQQTPASSAPPIAGTSYEAHSSPPRPSFLPTPSALMAAQQGSGAGSETPRTQPEATPDPAGDGQHSQVNALLAMLKAQQGQ